MFPGLKHQGVYVRLARPEEGCKLVTFVRISEEISSAAISKAMQVKHDSFNITQEAHRDAHTHTPTMLNTQHRVVEHRFTPLATQ